MTSENEPPRNDSKFPLGKIDGEYRTLSPTENGRSMSEILRIAQDSISRILDGVSKGGSAWFKVKRDEEIAKAFEVFRQSQERLSRISIERERLAMERAEKSTEQLRAQEVHNVDLQIKRNERVRATIERLIGVVEQLATAGVQAAKIEQAIARMLMISIDNSQRAERESSGPPPNRGQDNSDPIMFCLNPGTADKETIQEVFEALNELHMAHGGLGYYFTPDGLFRATLAEIEQ